METNLTAEGLMTVVGATAAAGTIVQFLKMLFNLSAMWVRVSCLIVGLGIVVGAGLTQNGGESFDFVRTLLLALVGMQAGMAAYAIFDTARSGFDYTAARREDPELGVTVTTTDPEDV